MSRHPMILMSLIAHVLAVCGPLYAKQADQLPNILFILADDLGYGDVGCYNSESKVPTPHLDQLAAEGMRFTDAHSPSTVCTPSRYGVMTGRMPFRLNYRGVFTGVGGPCLITADRLTLPEMLRQQGYTTALFGKWHIGLTFQTSEGKPVYEQELEEVVRKDKNEAGIARVRLVDFSKRITDGPLDRGFDYFYGTACCPTTDWLYAFIDGDIIPVPPSMREIRDRSKLPDHPYSRDCRGGLMAPNFDLEEVDMVFLKKSKTFLENHVKTNPDKPFFLLHSTQAVHLPSFPGRDFKGRTEAGPHGDFIFEFDYIVGELLKTLELLGVADHTLVMVASDNGPEVTSVLNMRATYHHDGARPWRGLKRDGWEGGHRTPFIVRWPGKVKAGAISDQLVSLTDVMATCAGVVGATLPNDAAEDSFNMLPVLLGEPGDQPLRKHMLQQTTSLAMSIRDGNWKYLDHRGSGGNDYSKARLKPYALEDTDPGAPGQLYDLATDPGETTNLYHQLPERVQSLKAQLEHYTSSGRSAPFTSDASKP